MAYRKTQQGVFNEETNMHIPNDPNNRHWKQFLNDAVVAGVITTEQAANNELPEPDGTFLLEEIITNSTPTLENAIREAHNEVDRVAGDVRLEYITCTPGQQLCYIRKEQDARAFKQAGYPEEDINDYPWLAAEANAVEDTGRELADTIIALSDQWTIIGAQIEAARRAGKVQIENQLSIEGVEVARQNAIQALEELRPQE